MPQAHTIAQASTEQVTAVLELLDRLLPGQGSHLHLAYDPGEDGVVGEDGELRAEPEPGGFYAVVTDYEGVETHIGGGQSAAEALATLQLIPPPPEPGTIATTPPF